MTTIVLVDDHRVVTRSLQAYLESFDDLKVVGVASSGEEALDHVDEWQPDVVLQDLLLPGGIEPPRSRSARRPSRHTLATCWESSRWTIARRPSFRHSSEA